MAKIKTILFDVDDTLFSTTAFARRARRNAVRAMIAAGLDASEDQAEQELSEVLAEFSSNYEHHYDRLLQRLGGEKYAGKNPALIVAAGVVAYHDTKFRELVPFDDVRPLLESLQKAGIQTGVVTHGWTTKQSEKLVRLGLVPYLDPGAVFISDQIGISKPNPKLYAKALEELGRQPSEVIYVGDSPLHDVVPPQSIGMVAVWARRAAKHDLTGTDVVPDHVIDDFEELRTILRETYGVDV